MFACRSDPSELSLMRHVCSVVPVLLLIATVLYKTPVLGYRQTSKQCSPWRYNLVDPEPLRIHFRANLEEWELSRNREKIEMVWKSLVQRWRNDAALQKLCKSYGWEGAIILALRQSLAFPLSEDTIQNKVSWFCLFLNTNTVWTVAVKYTSCVLG